MGLGTSAYWLINYLFWLIIYALFVLVFVAIGSGVSLPSGLSPARGQRSALSGQGRGVRVEGSELKGQS
eukprot:1200793-Rhodomonas_salina.1